MEDLENTIEVKFRNESSIPYLILISIDGLFAKTLEKVKLKNLEAIREQGTSTERFVPVFPPDLFPAYYAASTGLFPEENGIVANSFFDPDSGREFIKNKTGENEGHWWGGAPFWTVLEKAGIKTASFFWPGTGAEIGGVRPTYYHPFEENTSIAHQMEEIKMLLSLGVDKRPHLFSLVPYALDEASHKFGPESQEALSAAVDLDNQLGKLMTSVKALGISANFMVVSFYGMVGLNEKIEYLEDYVDLSQVRVLGVSSKYLIYKKGEGDSALLDTVYNKLRGNARHFSVYRRKDLPERFHCSQNSKCGDLIVLTQAQYQVRLKRAGHVENDRFVSYRGAHGFDVAESPAMAGVFYAVGPQIREKSRLDELRSLQLKQLVLKLFGLKNSSGEAPDSLVMEKVLK